LPSRRRLSSTEGDCRRRSKEIDCRRSIAVKPMEIAVEPMEIAVEPSNRRRLPSIDFCRSISVDRLPVRLHYNIISSSPNRLWLCVMCSEKKDNLVLYDVSDEDKLNAPRFSDT